LRIYSTKLQTTISRNTAKATKYVASGIIPEGLSLPPEFLAVEKMFLKIFYSETY